MQQCLAQFKNHVKNSSQNMLALYPYVLMGFISTRAYGLYIHTCLWALYPHVLMGFISTRAYGLYIHTCLWALYPHVLMGFISTRAYGLYIRTCLWVLYPHVLKGLIYQHVLMLSHVSVEVHSQSLSVLITGGFAGTLLAVLFRQPHNTASSADNAYNCQKLLHVYT